MGLKHASAGEAKGTNAKKNKQCDLEWGNSGECGKTRKNGNQSRDSLDNMIAGKHAKTSGTNSENEKTIGNQTRDQQDKKSGRHCKIRRERGKNTCKKNNANKILKKSNRKPTRRF